ERRVAVSVWIMSYSIGGAIGPLIGGLLLQFFWWGSVFLVSVPVMALLLLVGPVLLPGYKDPNAGGLGLTSGFVSVTGALGGGLRYRADRSGRCPRHSDSVHCDRSGPRRRIR